MTIIQVKHVVSCSSEDTLHKADNLLKGDSYKKWTCGTEGEKQGSVILQLDKATTVHSIDVGNEGSAFVEILGGHSSSDDSAFQVILVTSSFMSPVESRNNTNMNRVRMFGPESLNKAVAGTKFDRIKIVCTQPFNKRTKYGLSFIKLHGPPGSGDQQQGSSTISQTTLGKYKLKDEKSSLTVGSFFKSRERDGAETQKSVTGAAAVRAASSSTSAPAKVTTPQIVKQPSIKRRLSDEDKNESGSQKKVATDDAPSSNEPLHKKSKESAPRPATGEAFKSLMKKVVFVLSGFKNPLRGELRQKAIDMGAKYEGDWGPGCTHLICAFANTPKFNQVKGKGKIVRKEWIADSYRKRMLLPWRRYDLSDGRDNSSEDSQSESEEVERVTPVKPTSISKDSPKGKAPAPKKSTSPAAKDDDEKYGGSTDEDGNDTEPMGGGSSGDDTEDEIKRAQGKSEDPYGGSTDEEADSKEGGRGASPNKIPDLPDFFSNKHFFLYGKFDSGERRQVNRFIVAFNGLIENYMNDKVNYVITNSSWDENFEQALGDNASLTFVRPRWLFACNNKLKMVPYQPYIVVPAN